jgi:uncharacterized membrane protein YesL
MSTARRTFGEGPLSRATALLYTLLVVEGLLVVTTLPTLVAVTLLERDASNVPLAALSALPLAPAVAAALTALRAERDVLDLHPATAFWHGYRRDVAQVLALWVPALAVLTVIGINLTHLDAGGVPPAWAIPLWAIGLATTLWTANAITISSQFAFRTRDVARLAVFFLFTTPGVTLGTAGVLALSAIVVTLTSEAVLLLAGSIVAGLLLVVTRPMAARVERDFVAHEEDADGA